MPPVNVHPCVSSGTRCLTFGVNILYPYFVYANIEALASLRICADSPKTSLLGNAINKNKLSCAGLYRMCGIWKLDPDFGSHVSIYESRQRKTNVTHSDIGHEISWLFLLAYVSRLFFLEAFSGFLFKPT